MVDTFGHLRVRLLLLLPILLWTLWATRGVVHKSTGAPRRRQFAPAQPAARIDESELDMGVAHKPFAGLGFLDRHRLADQRLADEDQVAGPFDHAVRSNPAHGGAVRIVGLPQRARIGAIGGAIERGRRGEIQGLVRTLVVVLGAEVVEAALLLGQRRRRRIGRFRLEGAVQALEAAVLLRLARLDPLRFDAELASCDSPPAPTEANGGPLSERIESGSPNSQNAASNSRRT